MEGTSLSPGVTRMVGLAAAMVSFAEGSELMRELAGVPVDAKQVERTAEALGPRDRPGRARRGRARARRPRRRCTWAWTAPASRCGPSELAGRAGKQPDGSSKTREVKLCTVWTAEGRDDEGIPVRDAGSVTYSAAIESAASRDTDAAPSDFAQRVDREARRRGFDQAERRVVLGDGAVWIWNLADEQFPGAIQIVDLFHAKQHLCDVAKAIYGPAATSASSGPSSDTTSWTTGKIDAVLAALQRPRRDQRRGAQVP